MAGTYDAAYSEFTNRFNLNGLNLKETYEVNRKLNGLDDFAFDSTPQKKEQSIYLDTLTAALTAYLTEKTKMENDKAYDMSDVSIVDFVKEFDKVMEAIRTDAAPEGEPYQHTPFAKLSEGVMASRAWKEVKHFNQPLSGIWGDEIRKGSLTTENLQSMTNRSISMLDSMVTNNIEYSDAAKKNLANVVMAKNTMAAAINKRSWTSWLNPLNWGPNRRENAYLRELKGKIEAYKTAGFPVDNVVPEEYTKNMLGKALGELQKTYVTKKQPAQNPATAVKSEEKKQEIKVETNPVKNEKTTESKNSTVQQNIKAPAVKLSSMEEALARYDNKSVKDNFIAEIEGIFPNDNNPMRTVAIQGIVGSMPSQIRGHWYPINSKATNPAKERSIKENAISSLKSFDMVAFLCTQKMNPVDKIVALQKVTNVFMRNFSPALSDSKYHKYLDNYFVQNASLEQIQGIVGKGKNIDEIMESACKELGVEKTKVYLPELSESKNDEKKTDKVEAISSVSKGKTIE